MKWQHSAGFVPFFKERDRRVYLLMRSALTKNELWEFPKGTIESGENALNAAKREFMEETGIHKFDHVVGFEKVLKYFYHIQGRVVGKTVTYFLCHSTQKTVRLSAEAKEYLWLDPDFAVKKVRHKNIRQLLMDAEQFLAINGH